MKPEKLECASADGNKINLEALYHIAPSCFTEADDNQKQAIYVENGGRKVRMAVNFNTLRERLGDVIVEGNEELYQFTWPGKQAARREAAAPVNDTLRPVPEESVDWDTTKNLYIEGDNLRVLKLLQKGYMAKVKMIYIDPPYNTGNDFVYHDDYAVDNEQYHIENGDRNADGYRFRKNMNSNGRFHSDWCSMMYSRLLVARSLLTEDGVIFISIDDNEVDNLRKICDEVFGEGNFVAELVWERAYSPKNDAKYISNSHDYILMYTKQIDNFQIGRLPRTDKANARYSNPDNDPRGVWKPSDLSVKTYSAECDYPITTPSGRIVEPPAARCWSLSSKAFEERIRQNRNGFGEDGNSVPCIKRFLSELKYDGMAPTSILFYKEVGHSQSATKALNKLMDGGYFDGPKPLGLINRLLIMANLDQDSLILDFFSGSATTAHAVMQLNAEDGGSRKYICVQLLEETPEDSEARKAGYKTIPDIAKERVRRAGHKIKADSPLTTQELDTGFRVFRLDSSNFKDVEKSPNDYNQTDLFADNIKDDRSELDLLFGAMLAWGVQLSLSMTSEEVDGYNVYSVDGNSLVACFAENVTDNVIDVIIAKRPQRVLFRDSCFAEDKTKINIFESFKQQLDWDEREAMQNIKVI